MAVIYRRILFNISPSFQQASVKKFPLLQFIQVANIKVYEPPPDFSHITIPERPKLKVMDKVPQFSGGIRPPKYPKRLIDMRGPELIHNKLLYKQFGIMAITGGKLKYGHFEMIRNTINRKLDITRMFAIWRVDPPWKPITKKSVGHKMGGGKGPIDHYVTPVKAGRIIIELGGKVELGHVQDILILAVEKMPFQSMVVSQEILESKERLEEWQRVNNSNPYTFEYMLKNNMQGCYTWVSPYDYKWFGKHR